MRAHMCSRLLVIQESEMMFIDQITVAMSEGVLKEFLRERQMSLRECVLIKFIL